MSLTDTKVKNLKPLERAYKVADTGGLYLYITKTGLKSWRKDYRYQGKRKTITLGKYPQVSLKDARLKNSESQIMLSEGIDPMVGRKLAEAMPTFGEVSAEFMQKQIKGGNWSEGHASKNLQRLENNLLPFIGKKAINEIEPLELLNVLKPVEERGAYDMARRVKQIARAIFEYAIMKGLCKSNPAQYIGKALTPHKSKHYETLTDPRDIAKLMNAINGYGGDIKTVLLLKLSPLTLTRPTELRGACWSEFDIESKEWRIPASKMKSNREHIIPLSKQAVQLLRELMPISGHKEYLFYSNTSQSGVLSDNTARQALHRLGFKGKMTIHGFRGMASTALHEMGWDSDIIERQLAHLDANKVRASYNHAQHLGKRKEMLQDWADYLDGLIKG